MPMPTQAGPLDNLGDLSSFGPLSGGLPPPPSPAAGPFAYPNMGSSAPAGFPGLGSPASRKRGKPIDVKLLLGISAAVLVCLAIVGIGVAAYRFWPAGFRLGSLVGLGHSTPHAAFEALKQAQINRNWGGMYDVLTPDSRDRLVSGFAMIAQMAAASDSQVSAILSKYGVAPPAEIPKPTSPGDFARLMAEMQQNMKKSVEGVRDKRGFFVELMNYFQTRAEVKKKLDSEDLERLANAELTDLTIEGDTARGKQTSTLTGRTSTSSVEFRRVNGGWLIHLPEQSFFPL
jgi:hypothetical protein